MGFAEALAASSPQPRKPKFDQILDSLDDTLRGQVVAALEDVTISCDRIRAALAEIDPPVLIGRSSLERWRHDHGVR